MAGSHDGRKRTWRFPLRDGTTLEVATPPRATEKQVRRRGRLSLVLGTLAAALMVSAIAMADTITTTNAIDTTTNPDTDTGTNSDVKAPGGSGTIYVYLNPNDNATDPLNGCNANGANPATLGVTSGDPTKVTIAAPGTVTVSGCGPDNAAPIGYSVLAGASGSVTVTVAYSSGGRGGNYTSGTFTVTIVASNTAPIVDADTTDAGYAGAEGSAIALDRATASDVDGPGPLSYLWTIESENVGSGSCSLSDDMSLTDAAITCTDNGTAVVKLTATESGVGGKSGSDTANVTIANVPPAITSFTCPTDPIAVGTPVTLTGTYTDAGSADTHTGLISWGDATTSTPAASGGSVSDSHLYSAAGIYTPSLTVTDDDGGADTETCEYVVVYDPSAGFVTGGGWINSPTGAYVPDPALTGKATFGFVSKYKKGANTPDGTTEFQFHAAGLNFKSTAYQWLVVSGSKATYKGWGTINGGGSYGFLLSAVDGTPDKFRIKIWDVGTGDIVYDNNLNGGDDADPATALGGGSIVIHTGGNK